MKEKKVCKRCDARAGWSKVTAEQADIRRNQKEAKQTGKPAADVFSGFHLVFSFSPYSATCNPFYDYTESWNNT